MSRTGRWKSFVLVLAVIALGLVPGAAQASSVPPEMEAALAAAGKSTADVVVQPGPLNYAGPSCPGTGWHCAPQGVPVLQESGPGGINNVECMTGALCIVAQKNAATNEAECRAQTTASTAAQSCFIFQSSTTGSNSATVDLDVAQTGTDPQSATQRATVLQRNDSGANTASIDLTVGQSSESPRRPRNALQQQHAEQLVTLDQEADEGANTATVTEHQQQSARAEVVGIASVTQRQNAGSTGPNADADIAQDSSTGNNTLTFTQNINQFAAGKALSGMVDQVQSSTEGGLKGIIHQESATGTSTYSADQDETQVLESNVNPSGTIERIQHGPTLCCISLSSTGATPDFATVTQAVTQNSTPAGAPRTNTIRATCESKQIDGCTTSSTLVQDGQVAHSTDCTDSSCDESIDCNAGETCNTVSREPLSEIHKAVRNVSNEESFTGEEAPSTTGAEEGDVLEYQITYHNHGTAMAPHVTVADVIRPHSTFVPESCTPACTVSTDEEGTETVSWFLGGVLPDTARVLKFRAAVDDSLPPGGVTITNQANAHEAGALKDQSNVTTVTASSTTVASCSAFFSPEAVGGTLINFDDRSADGAHITDQYASQGVSFESTAQTKAILYANSTERSTTSAPNSLVNDANHPQTSNNVPLVMHFDPAVARVGMMIGNGQGEGNTATLSLYRADGSFICNSTREEFGNNVSTFIGIGVNGAIVATAKLDYGNTSLSEEIDDLRFSTTPYTPPVIG